MVFRPFPYVRFNRVTLIILVSNSGGKSWYVKLPTTVNCQKQSKDVIAGKIKKLKLTDNCIAKND
jgi:hypothetical protein